MGHRNSYEAYRETQVLSASPLELVCILYRAAIDCIAESRRALVEGQIARRSSGISKAIEILDELSSSLNPEKGGELSRSLAELYDYMQRRLILANTRQSEAELAEVEGLLSSLLEAWTVCAAPPETLDGTRESDGEAALLCHY